MIQKSQLFNNKFNPKNMVDFYRAKAEEIKRANIYNYEYTYYKLENDTLTLDKMENTTRSGYEDWRKNNPNFKVGYAGTISAREIYTNDSTDIIGYVFEKSLSDQDWHEEIRDLAEQCFEKLCNELMVNDKKIFKYFLFNDSDISFHNTVIEELILKLKLMSNAYHKYLNDSDYKLFVDKIIK